MNNKNDSWFDTFRELFEISPPWMGPLMAAVTYAAFAWLIPWSHQAFFHNPESQMALGDNLIYSISQGIAPFLAGGVLLIWGVVEIQKFPGRFRSRGDSTRSKRKNPREPQSTNPPACPNCNQPMKLRTARRGRNEGNQFWGCSNYPQCKGSHHAMR